jgi:hypothetical protein
VDSIIGALGVVLRLPFALIAVVALLVWWVIVLAFVLVVWIVITPIFWLILMPFRLFSVPRKGGAEKLRRDLAKNVEGWKRTVSSLASDPGKMIGGLSGWWLGNKV